MVELGVGGGHIGLYAIAGQCQILLEIVVRRFGEAEHVIWQIRRVFVALGTLDDVLGEF